MGIAFGAHGQLRHVDTAPGRGIALRRGLLALAASALLGGCGGSGSDDGASSGSGGGDTAVSTLQCESVATAVTAAPPLTRVSLTGLAGADPDTGWVQAQAAGTDGFPTALYGNQTEGYQLLVPLHPAGPGGGALTLTVTDGTTDCPGIAFNVDPLPAATGDAAGELKASMASVAAALADSYQADPATLAATPLDQLDPELAVLAMLFASLEAVDLDAELAALSPEQRQNLQALLARLDLAPLLDDLAAQVRALPVGSAGPTVTTAASLAAPSRSLGVPLARVLEPAAQMRAGLRPLATPADCVNLGAVDRNRFGLETPEDLADYLEAARGAADSIGPLRDGINDLNAAFMVLGLVPGGGWGAAGISVLWSWASFTVDLIQQMRANLYPSAISRLDFQLTETRIPEDWDTARDGPLRWSGVRLFATNNGMNMTRAIVDGTLNTVSSAFAGAGAARGALNTAEGLGLGAADMAGRAAIDSRLNELQGEDVEVVECWNIAATEFFPVPVPDGSGEQWVRARLQSGDAVTLSDRDITPVRIGSASLRVETNTDNLPGPRGFLDRDIEVARKSVVWIPGTLVVREAGNRETVRVRFDDTQHADPADVQFSPDPELFIPIEIAQGNNVYEVMFTTPEDPAAYPLEYTARSISGELPPGEPPRSATLTILGGESIAIAPRSGCVANGEARDLTATVSSIDTSPTVSWQVVAGQGRLIVGGNGQVASYVAPDAGSGQATIRATLEGSGGAGSEPASDQVTLSYGNCAPVAVFYEFEGSYDLPGILAGCLGPGEAGEQFTVRNDNDTNDGKNPQIPLGPADFVGPGSVVSINEALFSPGNRGNGSPDQCANGTFPVDMRNDSSLQVTAAGDTIAYDLDLTANGTCASFGDGVAACSSAEAFSGVWVRYALPVERATSFIVDLNLACGDNVTDPVPTTLIQLFFTRVDANGAPVPNHRDPAQFIQPVREVSCAAASDPITFAVDEPATAGTTDTMTVMIVTGTGIGTTTEAGTGQQQLNASLTGTVQVREAR